MRLRVLNVRFEFPMRGQHTVQTSTLEAVPPSPISTLKTRWGADVSDALEDLCGRRGRAALSCLTLGALAAPLLSRRTGFLAFLEGSVGLVKLLPSASLPYPWHSCLFCLQVPQTGRSPAHISNCTGRFLQSDSPEQRVFLRRHVRQAELILRRFAYGPSWLVTKRMGFAMGATGFAGALEAALLFMKRAWMSTEVGRPRSAASLGPSGPEAVGAP
jgi:hypothetical protein